MSAIYGIINLDGRPVEKAALDKMEQEYREFKIDRFSAACYENAVFGAGLQFIRRNTEKEILPYLDEKNNNLFTADCYIDNRKELRGELEQTGRANGIVVDEDTTDGMLCYLAFLKWGQEFTDHLLGVFAIAIYEYDKKKFHLYVDHCGDRCAHYYLQDNTVYFSTIMRPIRSAAAKSLAVSEKYIAACESNVTADMVVYPGMTPYEGLYQLLAGEHLIAGFDSDKAYIKVERYYDPVATVKPLRLSSDDEYKKLFLETFSKCVTDTMDVDGNIAAFLSSGLDSSSVAAFAALRLREEGKELHSYTSVPIKEFLTGNARRLEDESEPVKRYCEYFGNIIPTFVDCEGKSALTELQRFVRLFCAPVKYAINAVWMDEIYRKAAEDGCKLILKGQHGNASVSYGGLITRMNAEFKRLNFGEMVRQYRLFSHQMVINRKAFIKAVCSEIFSIMFPTANLDYGITRKDLLRRYQIRKEYIRTAKRLGGENIHSELQRRRTVYMPASFQQVSYANAHFELEYGIIARDPTRDKRIIELCIAFPPSCFADGAYERRLITYYMKDILPEVTRRQIYNRGLQSADYMRRIKEYTPDKEEYIDKLSYNKLKDYLDNELIKKLNFDPEDDNNTLSSLNALSLYLFLKD